ncbi:MAG TPA: hypothetical protein VJU83_00370 [Burkholderiales bacterium]|nr:hypothetical protein [Burkholderiales bacterium]
MKRSSSQTALDKARAEIAAKRKKRETRFADTVLGWESEEEAARDGFPATVIGWDHPAAQTSKATPRAAKALPAEVRNADAAVSQKAKRIAFVFLMAVALVIGGFVFARIKS